jgi:hypothetical protein
VHLRAADALGDLALQQVLAEPQADDLAVALAEGGRELLDRDAVLARFDVAALVGQEILAGGAARASRISSTGLSSRSDTSPAVGSRPSSCHSSSRQRWIARYSSCVCRGGLISHA